MQPKVKTGLWYLAFAAVIVVSLLLRYPLMKDGHVDEVHTIGRALNIIYTGDLNPRFFYHPTGTLYLCIPWNILALASLSTEIEKTPLEGGGSPLETFMKTYPNPTQHSLFNTPEVSRLWDLFRYKVRWYNVMLIPAQMILLAYIGWRLNLLAPAWGASLLLAFSDANIRDSVYVSVNSTTGFFCTLTMAVLTFFVTAPPVKTLWQWLARMSVLSFIVGLAVACKYNAGTFLLIPFIYALYSMRDLPNGTRYAIEKTVLALPVIWIAMGIGFTLLSPYWLEELARFIQHVLSQVYYFKVGHREYNTFEPGLEMAGVYIQCLADQYSWFGLVTSVFCMGYLAFNGFFHHPHVQKQSQVLLTIGIACFAFLLLMSNQAVFFSRNLSIVWSGWFFCTCAAWWYAPAWIAKGIGIESEKNIYWVQCIGFSVLLFISLLKSAIIDPSVFTREWWRLGDATIIALKYWF